MKATRQDKVPKLFPQTIRRRRFERAILRRLGVSVSERGTAGTERSRIAGAIQDLSSDADFLDVPVRVSFSQEDGIRRVSTQGFLGTRAARSQNLGLGLRADNLSFTSSQGLVSLSLGEN